MKYEIITKYSIGDTVYTIREENKTIECEICKGHKQLEYDHNKFVSCHWCAARGFHITSDKVFKTIQTPFKIKRTTINIQEDNSFHVKHKISSNGSTINRCCDRLFPTLEEAELECKRLNSIKRNFELENIIITDDFERTTPSIDKIQKKLQHYSQFNKFETPIKINSKNELIDGYINYLICKMLKIDKVTVIMEEV